MFGALLNWKYLFVYCTIFWAAMLVHSLSHSLSSVPVVSEFVHPSRFNICQIVCVLFASLSLSPSLPPILVFFLLRASPSSSEGEETVSLSVYNTGS